MTVRPTGTTMMNMLAKRVIAAAAVLLFGVGSLGAQVQVRTEAGLGGGGKSADGKVVIFKGIPFAAPPVGELRWKEPQPVARWKGVRKATEFGARCMQALIYEDMVFRDAGPSEDCLYLNVWAPGISAKDETAGDGVDLWRRISGGGDFGAAAGWRAPGAQGRGDREHELPAGDFWIFFASGIDSGVGASCFGKLWVDGSGGGAEMGAREYCGVWR